MSHRTATPSQLMALLNGAKNAEREQQECVWCGEALRWESAPFHLVPTEEHANEYWHYGCWRSYLVAKGGRRG